MKIGKQLKLLRIEKDMKQCDLAKALGITPQYLSSIEGDKRSPSIRLLHDAAMVLDANIEIGLIASNLNKG